MQVDWMVVLLFAFMAVQTIVNFSQGRRLRKLKADTALKSDLKFVLDVAVQAKANSTDWDLGVFPFKSVPVTERVAGINSRLGKLEKHLGIELTTEPAKPEKQFYRPIKKSKKS